MKVEIVGFNGAALFQVRINGVRCGYPLRLSSFNGAALFQVRITEESMGSLMSSMELQWGRTFSSADNESPLTSIDFH